MSPSPILNHAFSGAISSPLDCKYLISAVKIGQTCIIGGLKKGCFVGTLNEVALWNFLAANETILHAEFYIEKFS